jgi:hypothetical protein
MSAIRSSELRNSEQVPIPVQRESLTPLPFFVVESSRKLSQHDEGKKKVVVYIIVCLHEAMLELPGGQEFVICDEVHSISDVTGASAEIYHALLRPDLIDSDLDEISHQLEEVKAALRIS